MNACRRCALSVVIVLLLGTALFPGTPARAQCMVPTDITSIFCYPYMGFMVTMTVRGCFANLVHITNTMTMEYLNCMPSPIGTDSSNLTYCGYIMGQRRLLALRPYTGTPTMAHCQITCDCGVLRIDEGDGLPVELLDFGIEDDDEDQAE